MSFIPYPTAFLYGTVWFYTSTSNKRAARPYHYELETELENFIIFQSIFNDILITECVRYLQRIS
jgi:hypothetical protein